MKAVIVDDEPKAIHLIEDYCSHVSSIEVVATFRGALKAFEFVSRNSIDIIFLDINMPELSGMSLAKMLDPRVKVIFTTAYSEYATESYDVGAVDYLLKPISLDRFLKAVSKVIDSPSALSESQILTIKSGTTSYRLNMKDILFLEKDSNYITYNTTSEKILARQTINEALIDLSDNFIQVHKSFIVNLDKINSFSKESIRITDIYIPVGESFRSEFLRIVS
ncbi:MAG: response regulator transcription factor [Bacteroidota bacterium]